jgi:hypothetical protein
VEKYLVTYTAYNITAWYERSQNGRGFVRQPAGEKTPEGRRKEVIAG